MKRRRNGMRWMWMVASWRLIAGCGRNQGNSPCGRRFNLIWQGPNCPITVVRNLWRCPDQRGHRIRRLSIFKCADPLKRALKNQTCAEKRQDPSHRHAMMAQRIRRKPQSVFSICIMDRMWLQRRIVSHAPLKTIVQNTVCCWGRGVGPVAKGTTLIKLLTNTKSFP